MIDRRLITAALFAAVPALGGCLSGTTYGTGQMPELAVFSEMTGGLTGRNKKKEPINYQPRAPLVMPPDGQLQQPVQTASTQGGQWPASSNNDGTGDRGTGPDDENARDDITPEYNRRLRPIAALLPDSDKELKTPTTAIRMRSTRSRIASSASSSAQILPTPRATTPPGGAT